MLLVSIAVAVAAIAVYALTPALLIYWKYPWPIYGAMLASVALALGSRRRGILRYTTVGLTGLATVAFLVVTLVTTRLDHGQLALRPGDSFPDFTLTTSTKRPFSSAELRGQSAALYIFYRGDW
jgi:ABC-type Na+ efflux pump permease subunit